jgi:predicted transposase/invertase (TIGR01784 family)
LDKAKEKLRYENLSEEDKKMYDRFQENRRIEISVEYTAKLEAKQEEKIEVAKNLISLGSNNEFIVKATGLTVEQIEQLRNSKQ